MIPLPTFKTRTIHYDEWEMKFWILEDPQREFGTSTSLEGCYLASPAFNPGVTVAFPLDSENDLPKFYLNPLGQLPQKKYILDSPVFIREVEVKYPRKLPLAQVSWAVLHIDENAINTELQKAIEQSKGSMWEQELTSDYTYRADIAKDFLSWIRANFKVILAVPQSEFRRSAIQLAQQVYDLYKTLSIKHYKHEITLSELVQQIEIVTRPLHESIAKVYGLDYATISKTTFQHIQEWEQ
jgi:hypothetical protein